ncbi:hypothetical protein LINPERHAP1_LOCUS27287 [Linum perenne]
MSSLGAACADVYVKQKRLQEKLKAKMEEENKRNNKSGGGDDCDTAKGGGSCGGRVHPVKVGRGKSSVAEEHD